MALGPQAKILLRGGHPYVMIVELGILSEGLVGARGVGSGAVVLEAAAPGHTPAVQVKVLLDDVVVRVEVGAGGVLAKVPDGEGPVRRPPLGTLLKVASVRLLTQ